MLLKISSLVRLLLRSVSGFKSFGRANRPQVGLNVLMEMGDEELKASAIASVWVSKMNGFYYILHQKFEKENAACKIAHC